MSERRVLLGYAVDVFGPLFAWWVTRLLGVSMLWGLSVGLGIAFVSVAANTFRRRKMDAVGVLVLLEIIASIGLLFWLHSPRMLLIRASCFSAIAAFYLMGSAFTARPLSLDGSRPMATKGDAMRTVAWEKAWQQLPQFRMGHRMLTFGSGVAFLTDAVLRVAVVYRFPVDRAAWLAHLPHVAAGGILILAWAIFGRWAGPLVDGVQQELARRMLTSQSSKGPAVPLKCGS
jgi:hypothetical protein